MAALALTLAACGSSSSGSSGASGSSASSPSAGSSAGATTGSSAAGTHTVRDASLGTIVVDGKGFTLYRFDMDTSKPSKSNCTGQCAALWPAVPATDATHVTGIDPKLLGSVAGSGGVKQLTLDGWPLYTYAQDSKAGDTTGQGVLGTWWAVTPTGAKAKAGGGSGGATTSAPATTGTSSGGSYGY